MDKAATRMAEAVEALECITIFGDYDVDGATSAALLIRLLRELGVSAAAYIPDRLMEGYGPSGEALVRLAQGGSTLIVTVDRKGVVEGKSVSVRVDIGGRRIITKTKHNQYKDK